MSDRPPSVFISYSHLDEVWKDRLVRHLRVLAVEGQIEMWHDRLVQAGDAWKEQIEGAIDRADVAILLVSADFLTSAFIREKEIARILQRRAITTLRVIPVIVKPCAWLKVAWLKDIQVYPRDGRALSKGTDHQVESDFAALALEVLDPTQVPLPRSSPRPRPRTHESKRLGFAFLPAVLVATLVAASTAIRVRTPLQLDILARAVVLTVAGNDPVSLLDNSTAFSQLVIEACNTVSFPPMSVEVEAISHVTLPSTVIFRCDPREPGSKVLVRAHRAGESPAPVPDPVKAQLPRVLTDPGPVQALGSLGRITAEPGDRVALKLTGASLRVEVSRSVSFDFAISKEVPFDIVSEFAEVDGIPVPDDPDGVITYRANLPASNVERLASVTSGRGLNIVLEPAGDAGVEGLFRADVDIPIESVSLFQRSDVDDGFVSTTIRGTLKYLGRSDSESVAVSTGDRVRLGRLAGFHLTQLRIDRTNRTNPGLWFSLRGEASEVSTNGEDRRLTLFDRVLADRTLALLGIIAAAVFQLAWLRRYRWPSLKWR